MILIHQNSLKGKYIKYEIITQTEMLKTKRIISFAQLLIVFSQYSALQLVEKFLKESKSQQHSGSSLISF